MAFIPTPNTARVDMQFVYGGQQIHNVIMVQGASPFTQSDRDNLDTAIEGWWTSSAKSYFANSFGLAQITITNQDSDAAPSTVYFVNPIVYGTGGSGGVTNSTALCVSLRTNSRGRSYRGRMYLGGMLTSNLQDTVSFILGLLPSIITVLQALNTAIAGLSKVWVIVSKQHNLVTRVAGVATPITGFSVDQYIDSQRRRLALRGQ